MDAFATWEGNLGGYHLWDYREVNFARPTETRLRTFYRCDSYYGFRRKIQGKH